jgi:hypothetical protein
MNKDKLKYVPFNLFWCTSSFLVPFVLASQILTFDTLDSALVALYVYLIDVRNQTDMDYLSEKIENIADKQNKLNTPCSCDKGKIACPGCYGEQPKFGQPKFGTCAGCKGAGIVTCGKCGGL